MTLAAKGGQRSDFYRVRNSGSPIPEAIRTGEREHLSDERILSFGPAAISLALSALSKVPRSLLRAGLHLCP
jgi:hypothetical protein